MNFVSQLLKIEKGRTGDFAMSVVQIMAWVDIVNAIFAHTVYFVETRNEYDKEKIGTLITSIILRCFLIGLLLSKFYYPT